jgi:inner membrane protein
MHWGLWVIAGFGLLAAELLTPGGFFLFFFGIAGILVGGLTATGLLESARVQWALFPGVAVTLLLLFRRRLVQRLDRARKAPSGSGALDSVEGEVATLLEDLPPGAVGKAELRGTPWSVKALEPVFLLKGQRCRVERVEGLTLLIRQESTKGNT